MPLRRDPDFVGQRQGMVERQLRRRGIHDERVLRAMAEVPREAFVPEAERRRAYADSALPIGEGQTISQPWIVAAICQSMALRGEERVLEVGTGSGYSAAVLARLVAEVISIERQPDLALMATERLAELGFGNVEVIVGDGTRGCPERAPFEAIAVHATAPAPPETLLSELGPGGRLVAPISADRADLLTVFMREETGFRAAVIGPARFVPLIGDEGYEESS